MTGQRCACLWAHPLRRKGERGVRLSACVCRMQVLIGEPWDCFFTSIVLHVNVNPRTLCFCPHLAQTHLPATNNNNSLSKCPTQQNHRLRSLYRLNECSNNPANVSADNPKFRYMSLCHVPATFYLLSRGLVPLAHKHTHNTHNLQPTPLKGFMFISCQLAATPVPRIQLLQ